MTLLISNKRQILHSRKRQVQVDLTNIRVHQHGTWAGGGNGEQGVGRSRDGNTSKIHLVGDGTGNGLGWQVTAGQAGDAPEPAALLVTWLALAQEVVGFSLQRGERLR